MTRARLRRAALLVVVACAACAPPRRLAPPLPPSSIGPPPTEPRNGSLWHPNLANNYPVADVRARFPGDLLTVVVAEQSRGRKDAATDAAAESSISARVQDFFGVPTPGFLPSGFNPEQVVRAEAARDSRGEAETERTGSLSASITVNVMAVEPNGALRVQGGKVITVNREEQYLVLTGLVRPEDITADNSVLSSRVADAHIDYYGLGVVGDKQGVPWAHRLWDWLWPL